MRPQSLTITEPTVFFGQPQPFCDLLRQKYRGSTANPELVQIVPLKQTEPFGGTGVTSGGAAGGVGSGSFTGNQVTRAYQQVFGVPAPNVEQLTGTNPTFSDPAAATV